MNQTAPLVSADGVGSVSLSYQRYDEDDSPEHHTNQATTTILPWNSWKTEKFWLLFLAFGCITGCGLFVINNLSTMVQSMGAPDELAGTLIITLSLSNALGRITMGTLGDVLVNRPKLFLLQMTSLIMATILLLASTNFLGQSVAFLVIMVIFVAMAYGGSYVAIVAILTNMFGKSNFGKDYGLMGMAPALSGLLFNTISAWWYEQHTNNDDNDGNDTNVCVGAGCYRMSYIMTGCAGLVGFAFLRVLLQKSSTSTYPTSSSSSSS